MELVKESLQMLGKKNEASNQITMDMDYNVPDIKPDVGRMVQEKAHVQVSDTKILDGQILIRGELIFKVLYVDDGKTGKISSMEGRLPFEENLNLSGVKNGDKVCVNWDLEDLSIHLLNSRKLNIRALITFRAVAEEMRQLDIPTEIQQAEEISQKKKELTVLNLKLHKKDTIRIKKDITLPSNKPNIYEIVWDDIRIRGVEARVENGSIKIQGEIFLFVLYDGSDESNSMQWMEQSIPFEETIECSECSTDLISLVDVRMQQSNLEVKPDSDGEERVIEADVLAEVQISLYEEVLISLLQDVYTPLKEHEIIGVEECLEHLLVKNFSKCKISERTKMDVQQGKILQICHSNGEVKLDEIHVVENGIQVEGVIDIRILYIISDDEMPFYSMSTMIPFSHLVEARGMNSDCHYSLKTDLEQLSTSMLDSNEIEVKAVINVNALVFQGEQQRIISQIEERELDMEKIQNQPGIVGYKVQKDDTLWDIAKKFCTTIDSIKEFNELQGDSLEQQEYLILVKQV